MLDVFFDNVDMVKKSPCSLTVEYITCDETLSDMETFKAVCEKKLGALPQVGMPRDDRRKNSGLFSKYSYKNYIKKWNEVGFRSEFFNFRIQMFGKKYTDYCYAGDRYLWVNMSNGYSYQCYHTPPLQNFMGELDKPVKWLAIGNCCTEAHCYSAHSFMTLGVAPPAQGIEYRPTYGDIRNRVCLDGSEWVKPTFQVIFARGIEKKEHSRVKKAVVNRLNTALRWYRRKGGKK
jgi:hypothetical protein